MTLSVDGLHLPPRLHVGSWSRSKLLLIGGVARLVQWHHLGLMPKSALEESRVVILLGIHLLKCVV